jgi:hypothetical protein
MTRSKTTCFAVCAAGAILSLAAACSPSEDPAKVCLAADTQNGAKQLLAQIAAEAAKVGGASSAGLNFADPKVLSSIQFGEVALSAVDPTTHKITCKAQVSISLPANVPATVRDKVKDVGSSGAAGVVGQLLAGGKAPLAFSRQPQADGKGFLYALEGKDDAMNVAGGLMLVALAANAAPPKTETAAAAPSDSPAVESSTVVAPVSPEGAAPATMDLSTKVFVDDSSFHLHSWGTLGDLKAIYAKAGMPNMEASCLSKACKHIGIIFAGPKNAIDTLIVEPFTINGVSGWAITEEQGDTGKIKGDQLLAYLASIQALGQTK